MKTVDQITLEIYRIAKSTYANRNIEINFYKDIETKVRKKVIFFIAKTFYQSDQDKSKIFDSLKLFNISVDAVPMVLTDKIHGSLYQSLVKGTTWDSSQARKFLALAFAKI